MVNILGSTGQPLLHSLNFGTAKQPQKIYKGRGLAVFQHNSIYKKRYWPRLAHGPQFANLWSEVTFVTLWPSENLESQKYSISPCYRKPSVVNLGLALSYHKLLVFQMELIKWVNKIKQKTDLLNSYWNKTKIFCGYPKYFMNLDRPYGKISSGAH